MYLLYRNCSAMCDSGYQFETGMNVYTYSCNMFDMAAMYDAPKCVRIGMEYFVIVTFMICVFIYT